jgi:uncharacterized protein YfaS (alpha-2-macroglobulin family)
MKRTRLFLSFLFVLYFFVLPCGIFAEEAAHVEMFSPQGTVKGVRQVSVRFSAPIVPFGEPRVEGPFDVDCPEKGRGRWADAKNWVFDFERDLPAGVVCEFRVKPGLKSLAGGPVGGQRQFSFSTGGPAVKFSFPYEGSPNIDENQIFLLALDSEAVEESVVENVSCAVGGINERIGVRIIHGEEREQIVKAVPAYGVKGMPLVAVRCNRVFPNGAKVSLIWGKGVASPSGVKTTDDQVLPFVVRPPFTASVTCERENAAADCIPLLPIRVQFPSQVSWGAARKILLRSRDRVYRPDEKTPSEEGGQEGESPLSAEETFVYGVTFRGPFPEKASLIVEMPQDIRDDAGRTLSNRDRFPLTIKTDAYPPLAKFAARFGIIELKGDAVLPVTLRNLEPDILAKLLKLEGTKSIADGGEYAKGLTGRLRKIRMGSEEKIIAWLKKVASAKREASVFHEKDGAKEFSLPKPGGTKAFEVVGIPLEKPGFYVVEMESRILGESLLGAAKPMYVPTAAVVTNLSAHFKWARESSVVWVTSLGTADPVGGASVTIRDCNGKMIWKGRTDKEGVAEIKTQLPRPSELPHCDSQINFGEVSRDLRGIDSGLFVFATAGNDMTFVHSSWDDGIEPWRYGLPSADYYGPVVGHTIFDRTLLRAGETLHMKHVVREHTMSGFSAVGAPDLPRSVVIYHLGSDQRYQFPLKWDAKGVAETVWDIPKEAKLGYYRVVLSKKSPGPKGTRTVIGGYEEGDEGYYDPEGRTSGSFRVEEFRVPLMKGIIQQPKGPLVKAREFDVDLAVRYLSGGGAGMLPVRLRSQTGTRYVSFGDYEDFSFGNGGMKEEIIRRTDYEQAEENRAGKTQKVETRDLLLDRNGMLRTRITDVPPLTVPSDVLTELEFRDPSGEVQTVSSRIPVWPSKVLVGIKPDSWASSMESFRFQVVLLDLGGKPVGGKAVKVELFRRRFFSHRKRLVGGFYSYEHVTETKRVGPLCEGKTDARGLLICNVHSPVSGNVILQASAFDEGGNLSVAHRDVWVAGKGEWWFDVSDNDRIDLLPEKKRYEPGETAKFQVRMPFRKATALVTVEREGIIETSVKKLSGRNPVVRVPIKGSYAPNVFVSVLAVRGRVSDVGPTAMVDLGKPAYKLGIAEIRVGWKAHELKVGVSPEKKVYKIREKARVDITVRKADGGIPPSGGEIAVAVVDEGLLELMPNSSWDILGAMMGRRGYEAATSTAQMQVVGKRHYGLKAIPQGGGGGKQVTRELFDTLLLWKARVPLGENGKATVEIPLNDSLTSFRIAAVATAGIGLFGSGQAGIRTTQDVLILSGIPPVVREGDAFRAGFTVRNTSARKMDLEISGTLSGPREKTLPPLMKTLSPGESCEVGWDVKVPNGIDAMGWEVRVKEKGGEARDTIRVRQKVAEAVPVRVFQATLAQVKERYHLDVGKPEGALSGKGGVSVSLRPTLSNGLGGVTWYMKRYPYSCMEQETSRAVALRDEGLWKSVVAELPAHLDQDGLVKYFPAMGLGSDALTAYMLSISDEAGWAIPEYLKTRMQDGLKSFIEGRVIRYSSLPTADLSIRKLAAIEALSRDGKAEPTLLDSLTIEPNLWPTSAVIDWLSVLSRVREIPNGPARREEARQILRSRINFQGSTMGFSTEGTDGLWWLMVSTDLNAVKSLLAVLNFDDWREDIPRLVRGALARQHHGAWDLTTANAWGVLAIEKFSKKFETATVTGATSFSLGGKTGTVEWSRSAEGGGLTLPWPKGTETLDVSHQGAGGPWITVRGLAAVPLKKPLSSGYTIRKTLLPVQQKAEGIWTKGDVIRVRLELQAQADMTWVVVSDPIPAGSAILGTGLGRDSQILTKGEEYNGWVFPAFEERSFEAFRAYYEFVPKGKWTIEYTVRLNNGGAFNLPATRVEALYSPEMFGEMPNPKWDVGE